MDGRVKPGHEGNIAETILPDSETMVWSLVRRYWPLSAFVLLFSLYGWAVLAATSGGHDGVLGPAYNALGADWVIWQTAAQAFFTHDLTHIYDQLWITHAVNDRYGRWLSSPLPFPVFPYPPVTLLTVLPFAGLPMPWSMLGFELVSFTALALALRKLAPERAAFLFLLAAAVLAPAASNNLLAGQNGFLTAALVTGGIAVLDTNPLLAGALFGAMIVKPQFLPLLAVVLIAARQHKALAAMAATALALVAASVPLFGFDLWLAWIDTFLHPQAGSGINGNAWGHMWDESVSTCMTLLGAPSWLAMTAQAGAALLALIAVWRAFRRNFTRQAQLGVLGAAILLASPHLSPYDMVLLSLAAAIQVWRLSPDGRLQDLLLPLAAWLAPLYNPPRVIAMGFLTPLVLGGLIFCLLGGFRPKMAHPGACEAAPNPL